MSYLSIKLSGDALSAVQFQPQASNDAPRQFSGIAHSGLPFEHYGTRYIVDLSNIQPLNANVGVLIEHNPNQRAGSGVLSVQNHQLHISGSLLNNEHGKAIADDADGNFPFEMSAYIQSSRWEELSNGATAVVNGQTVSGNIVIMRDCTVREVSFVAVGADKNTSAVVLSDGSPFTPDFQLSQNKETSMPQDEQKQFEEMKAKVDALLQENATLKAEKAKGEKKEKVDKKLSAAGFAINEEGKFVGVSDSTYALLLSANDDALDNVIGDLKLGLPQNKPKLPESLTTDTHTAAQPSSLQLSAVPSAPIRATIGGYQTV